MVEVTTNALACSKDIVHFVLGTTYGKQTELQCLACFGPAYKSDSIFDLSTTEQMFQHQGQASSAYKSRDELVESIESFISAFGGEVTKSHDKHSKDSPRR